MRTEEQNQVIMRRFNVPRDVAENAPRGVPDTIPDRGEMPALSGDDLAWARDVGASYLRGRS